MASGDILAIDWANATAANFRVTVTGIDDDIALSNFTADVANNRWSAEPAAGSWPSLSHLNGTVATPGAIQVVSAAAPNQLADVEGNLLAAGTVIFNRAITIAEPAIAGTLTAVYTSGLGAAGSAITASGSLGSSPLIVTVTSVEN